MAVKVDYFYAGEKVGEVTLVNGRAVNSNRKYTYVFQSLNMARPEAPDDLGKKLEPKDGEAYIRALPDNLRSANGVSAVLIEG